MKRSFLIIVSLFFLQFFTYDAFAGGTFYPTGASASVSGGTVCLGQARTLTTSVTANNVNCTSGALTNTNYTINWFFNGTTNSTTGGTLIATTSSSTNSSTATTNSINILSPTTCGQTFYYYAVVTFTRPSCAGTGPNSFTTTAIAVAPNNCGCIAPGTDMTFTGCSTTFYDTGGSSGNYFNNQNYTVTFCPSGPDDAISIAFTSFNTEGTGAGCTDCISIWQGNSATGNPDDVLGGSTIPPAIVSTSPDGCITLRFVSNGSVTAAGWAANVTCVTRCQTPTAVISSPDILNICPSDADNPGSMLVNFSAAGSTVGSYSSGSISLSQYVWDFGDNTTSTTSTQTTSHTFPGFGVYTVRLVVRDNNTGNNPNGCPSTNSANLVVNVLRPPLITASDAFAQCNTCADLQVIATPQTTTSPIPGTSGEAFALPDGGGFSHEGSINMDGVFPDGATVTAGCFPTICFDIDHSYSGDLSFRLIAPDGTVILLRDRMGGSNMFGDCTKQEDDGAPGCPRTYCVVNSGAANSITAMPTSPAGGPCPPTFNGPCERATSNVYFVAGTYNSQNSFNPLIGSPLNGTWTLRVTDHLNLDDGWIHGWSISFPDECYANVGTITPDVTSVTWGSGVTSTGSSTAVVSEPGPDFCPGDAVCEGDQITANGQVCYPVGATGRFSYDYTVTDEFGCNYSGVVNVDVSCNCLATASLALTGPASICPSTCSQISITVGNGTGPYNVVYSNGTSNFTLSNIAAGTHVLSVCPTSNTTYTLISVEDIGASCFGIRSGSASITLTPTILSLICPGTITSGCAITDVPAYATWSEFVAAGGSANLPVGATINESSFALLSEEPNESTCPTTYVRTYQVADNCGFTVTCSQNIVVGNLTAIVMPANGSSTVACLAAAAVPTPPPVQDNCGRDLTISAPVASADPACAGEKTYTFVYTDCTGATYDWVYTYTISEPVVTMPANTGSTVACPSAVVAPTVPTVTDNCGRALAVSGPVISAAPACSGTQTYTYTFTDCAGVTYPWVYTYTISAPVVTMPANGSSTVACLAAATAPTPPAVQDNCGRDLTISAPMVSADPACAGTKTYIYTYTDCSSAMYEWVYTYTISEPVVTMPANTGSTVACPSAVVAPTVPTVTDNCGRALAVSGPVISAAPACSGTQTYTYTFTDCAGVTYPWVYTYTIEAPVVTMPSNEGSTVACPSAVVAPIVPTVTDNCGRALAVSAPAISAAPACSGIQTYTYTFTDCAGVTYPWVYTYTIEAPVVTMPANAGSTVACLTAATEPTPPAVQDNCGRDLTISGPVSSADPACAGEKTYTFTYTDCTGATYPWVYTYTIEAPVVTMPSNEGSTVACPSAVVAPIVPTVTDNCGRALAVSAPAISAAPACSGTQTYTYTFTDCAGVTYPWVYTYTIEAPVVTMPSNEGSTVACLTAATEPTPPALQDNCGRDLTISGPVSSADPACAGEKTYTFTYTDCTGATYPWVYTYTIEAPVVAMPLAGASTVFCSTDAVAPGAPTIQDNCGRDLVLTGTVEGPAPAACGGLKTYTYTYEDCSGATYSWVYTYTIDSELPTFTVVGTDPTECGEADGFITISGLLPNTDYEFTYNGTATTTITTNGSGTHVVTGLTAGTYIGFSFGLTACPACSATNGVTINLSDPNPPFVEAPVDFELCSGDEATLTANNPDGAIITWNNGVVDGVAFTPPVGTTTYVVTANLAGCISTDEVTITVSPTVNALNCPGALTAICDISEQPAYADYAAFIAAGGSVDAPVGVVIDEASFTLVSETSSGSCPITYIRTYSVADACGVTVTCTQNIVVGANALVTMPANAGSTVACLTAATEPTPPAVQDNCGRDLTISGPVSSVDPACAGEKTYTFTYTDCTGATYQWVYTYTIEAPVVAMPSNEGSTVACLTAATEPTPPAVQDNCGRDLTISGPVSSADPACAGEKTYTFTYTDCTGATYPWVYTYTIEAPVVAMPLAGASTVFCSTDAVAPGAPTIQDNCGRDLVLTGTVEGPAPAACGGLKTYTYTYEDCSGATYSWVYTYTIDSELPTFTVVGTDPTECGEADGFITISGLLPNTDYEFTYNGTATTTITTNGSGTHVVTGLTAGTYIGFSFGLTACPACSATNGVTINLSDPNPPFVEAPADFELCSGDEATLTANNPDGAIITWNNGVVDGVAFTPPVGTTTYIVTAELDGCTSSDQVIVRVSPVVNALNCPGALTATCDISEQPAYADYAAFIAAGGSVDAPVGVVIDEASFTLVSETSSGSCPITYIRTYSVADACGVTVTCTQNIVVGANALVTMPANAGSTVACLTAATEPTPPAVQDNCGRDLTISGPVSSADPACAGEKTYTFTYTDCTGATYPWVYTYTIEAPVVTMPSNEGSTVACLTAATEPTPPAVQDNCGRDLTISGPVSSADPACAGEKTYTFTYTDCTGATYPWVYTYTIEAPVVAMPLAGASTVFCSTDAVAPGAPTIQDNCGRDLVLTGTVEGPAPAACGGLKTYTYTYEDCSGATYSWVYTYTIDSELPTFTVVGTDPTECGEADGFITISGLLPNTDYEFTYNGTATTTITTNGSGTHVVTGLTAGTYIGFSFGLTACPACSATNGVTINLSDPNPPFVEAPVDFELCSGDEATLTANNPDGAIITWNNGVVDGVAFTPPVGTTTYVVTANLAGCISTDEVTVFVPESIISMSCPGSLTATCDISEQPAYADYAAFTAAGGTVSLGLGSQVDESSFTLLSEVSDGLSCPQTVTRTYQVADTCGTTVECTQQIIINDLVPPTGTAPAPVTVQCIVPPVDITTVTSLSDNCTASNDLVVTHVSDVSDNNSCPEIITRTYRITDACGNRTDVTQIITIIDDIAPVFASPPADITVSCISAVPAMTSLDWTDNCDGSGSVLGIDSPLSGGTCGGRITRTWSYTDACGNGALVSQTITINDDIAPVLASAPADVTVSCISEIPSMVSLAWTDNCDGSGTVVGFDSALDGTTCFGTITRTWTYADVCNNLAAVTQIITIVDNIRPTGLGLNDITVLCASEVPSPNTSLILDVSDNCTPNPIVAFVSDQVSGNLCSGQTILRTYSITDDCSNVTLITQTINVTALSPLFAVQSTNPTACNTANGSISLTGLNPNSTYEFSYNGGPLVVITTNSEGSYIINNLPAGVYSAFAVQPVGCRDCEVTSNVVINLVDPNAPAVNAGPDQTVCHGTPVTLSASNPNGANLSWSNGVVDGNEFTPAVGTWTYVVTAELNNCFSTDEVVVVVNALPNVNAGADQNVCEGNPVILSASGANSYVWNNSVTNGVPFVQTETQQTYIVVGTDVNGCQNQDQVVVNIINAPVPSFVASETSSCVTPFQVVFQNTSPGTSAICNWNFGNGQTSNNCDGGMAIYSSPGCYDVTLTVTYANGCTNSFTSNDLICIIPTPVAAFVANPTITDLDLPIDFTNNSQGAISYVWNFGDGGAFVNQSDPTHIYTSGGSYVVTLVAINEFGCTDTASQVVLIQEPLLFYVPNTFTPDGDKVNPMFLPVMTSGFDPWDYQLLIFNRWGEVVFESRHPKKGWDGTYGGMNCPDGTYIWQIRVLNASEVYEVHRGHVNLVR
jgi:gliding motility-associated-like protein